MLETADLSNCSPATVSRCGIIYFSNESLPSKGNFNNWLLNLPDILRDQRKRLDQYFNFFIAPIMKNFLLPQKMIFPVTL
jgi:hypothetical protein